MTPRRSNRIYVYGFWGAVILSLATWSGIIALAVYRVTGQ